MSLRAQILIPVFLLMVVGICAGLVRRRMLGACYSFLPYLLVVATYEGLTWLWPRRFWTHDFYILKESVCVGLKLVIAVELAARVFRHFPTAGARARLFLFPPLIVGLLLLLRLAGAGSTAASPALADLQILTLWLLILAAGVAAYYNVPLTAFQRALLLGLGTYLGVFGILLGTLASLGFDRLRETVSGLNAYAWMALTAYWLWAAWRAEAATSPELLALLRRRREEPA